MKLNDRVRLVRPWSDGEDGQTGTIFEILEEGEEVMKLNDTSKYRFRVRRDSDGVIGLCSEDELEVIPPWCPGKGCLACEILARPSTAPNADRIERLEEQVAALEALGLSLVNALWARERSGD